MKQIDVLLNTRSTLRVQGFACEMRLSEKLVELNVTNLSFDIKDFKYDKYCQMFTEDILKGTLSHVSGESLMSLIDEKHSLMPSCQLGDYFTNKSILNFQIVIGDDTEDKNITYIFKTEVSPEILTG